MDPDLSRLCAIPGNDDLTTMQVEEVLQLSPHSVRRLTTGQSPRIECKRHEGRGDGSRPRIRVPRAAVVRYLVLHSRGDRVAILSAIKTQCPQYLPAVADLLPGAAAVQLPSNVIPITSGTRKAAKAAPTEHPGQMHLFDFPAQASA
jgi:hypothetical protein